MPLAFESHEDAQAAVDDWVLRNSPSLTADDVVRFEREHLQVFGERYGRLHVKFHVAFDQLVARSNRSTMSTRRRPRMDARGINTEMIIPDAHKSTLDEVTDWTIWADKTLNFCPITSTTPRNRT